MKKGITIVLALVCLLAFSATVLADAPFVTVEMTPIGTLTYTSFPQTYDVIGTVSAFDGGKIDWVKLVINGTDHGDPVNIGVNNQVVAYNFSFPWNIVEAGTYDVRVIAAIQGKKTGDDFETVEVILEGNGGGEVIVDYPAAPAIANELLREHNISHRYGKKGNYISDVAQQMGKGASFPDKDGIYIEKSDHEAYRAAVDYYLDEVAKAY